MTGADRAIRWSTIAAVAIVAGVAGWVSYEHALAVARAHGEGGALARVYPATVDGLIYSASMVLLDAARRHVPAPPLARWLLGAGIGVTLAANVAYGLRYGPVGATVAAWPALALVGSYELLMLLIRTVPADVPGPAVPDETPGSGPAAGPGTPHESVDVPGVPGPLPAEAQPFAAGLARGEVPSIRRIRAELHVGQPRAREIQARLETLTPAGQRIRRIREEIRQGAPELEDPPAGAAQVTPGAPHEAPAGAAMNGNGPHG